MGGSGGSLGSYISGARNADEVLLHIRHGAVESSVNLLLQQEEIGVDPTDQEIDDQRLEAIRLALLNGIGEVKLRPMGSFDVLVVFTTRSVSEHPPNELIIRMVAILEGLIPRESDIETVYRENFEVIVTYTDGMRYRLTPAVTTGHGVAVPSSDSSSWMPMGNH